jgi:hypothetical protein
VKRRTDLAGIPDRGLNRITAMGDADSIHVFLSPMLSRDVALKERGEPTQFRCQVRISDKGRTAGKASSRRQRSAFLREAHS